MGTTGAARGATHARLVLGVGAVGVVINVVDWFVGGEPRPYHAFPLLLVLWGAADLMQASRPDAARGVRAAAGVLMVAMGLAVGVPAAAALVRGDRVDWLDLVVGVVVVLYAASALAALVARRRNRGPAKEPAVGQGARIGENGRHERS
ncbi:hypothetical protein ACQI4E_07265 [Streptomyces sp. CA-252508]|uniref:hypothetical protein n=1 Tax=Streptomyces sp. CA-252508 TaxID=3418946 RepID=UPI003D930CD0